MASKVPEYEIRNMKRGEIPEVLDLWLDTKMALGGIEAIHTWFEFDPEAFFVAVAKDGTIIGVCAGVINNDNLAVVGLYAVRKQYRGLGIGNKICDAVRERYGSRNGIANPISEKHLEDYRDRGGYPIQTDWKTVTYYTEEVKTSEMVKEISGIDVCSVSPDDVELVKALAEYDADVIGFSRSRLFPLLCKEKDSVTLVARNSHDNSIRGYGMVKKCVLSYVYLGPLYADDERIAELILYHLIKSFPLKTGQVLCLITIDCNKDALRMFERVGFREYSRFSRLYVRKEENVVDFKRIFAQINDCFTIF